MKIIPTNRTRTRRAMLRCFLRWFMYAVILVFFYVCECNPLIRGYCPLIIIPLATAVAMFEGDLAAGVFGMACGLMLDMANGVTVVGFSALWLLAMCPFISLAAKFWVKVNFISHFLLNFIAVSVMAAMDMLFLHWVWEGDSAGISFLRVVLPSYGGAILFSVPGYFLVRAVSRVMRPKEEQILSESAENAEEFEEKEQK